METRHDQLSGLSVDRSGRRSGILRVHRQESGKLAGLPVAYIIGFIAMAVIAGLVIDKCHNRWLQLLGMIVGTAVCYAFGTAWFCISASYTVGAALTVCVIPFIPADLIKMVIAMLLGPEIKKRIR